MANDLFNTLPPREDPSSGFESPAGASNSEGGVRMKNISSDTTFIVGATSSYLGSKVVGGNAWNQDDDLTGKLWKETGRIVKEAGL